MSNVHRFIYRLCKLSYNLLILKRFVADVCTHTNVFITQTKLFFSSTFFSFFLNINPHFISLINLFPCTRTIIFYFQLKLFFFFLSFYSFNTENFTIFTFSHIKKNRNTQHTFQIAFTNTIERIFFFFLLLLLHLNYRLVYPQ